MATRTYSYTDPVLANKFSALADTLVNGRINALNSESQRQLRAAQEAKYRAETHGIQQEIDGRRGMEYFLNNLDPSNLPAFMAQSALAGHDGGSMGDAGLAYMANAPGATDDQVLRAFVGAGNQVDENNAFSIEGQDRVHERNAASALAEAVAKIAATPLTYSQQQAQILAGQPEDVQVATLFDPHNVTQDSVGIFPTGYPGVSGPVQGPKSPLSKTEVEAQILEGLPQDQQVASLFDPVSTSDGAITSFAPGDPRIPAGTVGTQFENVEDHAPGSSKATPRNYLTPDGRGGITMDGKTDESGNPLPPGTQLVSTSAPKPPKTQAEMIAERGDVATQIGIMVQAMMVSEDMPTHPSVVDSVTELATTYVFNQDMDAESAIKAAMEALDVKMTDNIVFDDRYVMGNNLSDVAPVERTVPTAQTPAAAPALDPQTRALRIQQAREALNGPNPKDPQSVMQLLNSMGITDVTLEELTAQ